MTEEQQPAEGTSDDNDTTTDEQPQSRPVTVPNVTPGAKSGLAHEVIGSAAQEAYDATSGDAKDAEDDSADGDGEQPVAEVPATEMAVGEQAAVPGEPLPPIPDDGTGKPLSEPASDSTDGSADDTPVDAPAAEDAAQGTDSGEASSGDEAASGV